MMFITDSPLGKESPDVGAVGLILNGNTTGVKMMTARMTKKAIEQTMKMLIGWCTLRSFRIGCIDTQLPYPCDTQSHVCISSLPDRCLSFHALPATAL
jgi:hypothetical protein